jgi:hypothetical protein
MEPTVKRNAESRIELFDASGRLIGTITRPVEPEVFGPGREKVYVARRSTNRSESRSSQAA